MTANTPSSDQQLPSSNLPDQHDTSNTDVKPVKQEKKSQVKASGQGFIWAWHGMRISRLFKLLLKGPSISFANLHKMLLLGLTAPHNSFYHKIEMLRYGKKIKQTEIKPPIFILGHWRSGTTLIHNLMTLDPELTYANTYHTLFPDHFLTTEEITKALTFWMVPETRPMDNMPASFELPQEDELALMNMCLVSPYLLLAFHGRNHIYDPYMEIENVTPKERQAWKDALVLFMKKITIRNNKPIVLKSPSHTFRIPLLLELFPDAKFIYIYRNPYAVAPSSFHLRRTICSVNCMGPLNFEPLEDEVLNIYSSCIKRYEETKHLVPTGNLYEIRYEDLEVDPLGEMQKLYSALKLDSFEQVRRKIEAQLPELRNYKKNKFNIPEELRLKIYTQLKQAFDCYGYSPELDG